MDTRATRARLEDFANAENEWTTIFYDAKNKQKANVQTRKIHKKCTKNTRKKYTRQWQLQPIPTEQIRGPEFIRTWRTFADHPRSLGQVPLLGARISREGQREGEASDEAYISRRPVRLFLPGELTHAIRTAATNFRRVLTIR